MNRLRWIAAALFLVFFSFVLTACGKEEYEAEYEMEDSIYVPRRLQGPEEAANLQMTGDYLYYTQGSEKIVWRVSAASLRSGEGNLDFSQAEKVFQFSTSLRMAPESILNVLEEGGFSGLQKENPGRLFMEDYTVDQEQNLYCFLRVYAGDYTSSLEDRGGILCKQTGTGEQVYQVYLPDQVYESDTREIAVDGAGRVYLLMKEAIQVLDADGGRLASISLEKYRFQGEFTKEELFGDSEGRVYYSTRNAQMARKGFEIVEDKGFGLKETKMFAGYTCEDHFAGLAGKRILCTLSNMMYAYDRESDSVRELFSLTDSGMNSGLVRSAAQVTDDLMLLLYGSLGEERLYLLTRTPLEELDEEYIVIASISPSIELRKAVTDFNMINSRYRVIIDDYGSEYSQETGKWDCAGLDAALVSGHPPDILDLNRLNIWKYADKGILEDLYPYLDESVVFSREDFLANVLEGVTIDGRLTCIPGEINVKCIYAKSSFVEGLESWTFEDVCRLTVEQPADGPDLLNDGSDLGWNRKYFLEEFCAAYYLDAFVDLENGRCDFDQEEFRDLLEWVRVHEETDPDINRFRKEDGNYYFDSVFLPEETMLVSGNVYFYSIMIYEAQCGSKMTVKGFPTADGRGKYPGEMRGMMSILTGSRHKEGAWEFLEYYLSRKSYAIPSNKLLLQQDYEKEVTPKYSTGLVFEDGRMQEAEPELIIKGYYVIDGTSFPYYAIPTEQADIVMEVLTSADFTPLTETEEDIIGIVTEEAEGYYNGDKSLEEVTNIIQNRAQLLLDERGR